jgi:hypothetical protein
VIQATKNDVGFLQLVDSGLQPPYCALEMARFLIFKSTMEIVHVSPATFFDVRQALTVDDQLALVLLKGTSKNTPSARPTNQIQRISLNLTTGSGCDGAIGFL